MGGIGKTTLTKEVYNHGSILCRFDVHAWTTVSQQHNRKEALLGLLRSTINMDDRCEVWDGVRQCFPTEDNAGSRILLTTRINEVACYASTENLSLQMNFMDQDERKFHGLSLTIVVVAGLLKSKRAIEDWGSVAKDVTSFITNDPDEQCSHVLGLSYNHLTSNLKTCLLHFGIFPEDGEIPAKKLMRTWMAEGFLKFENDLEGEAEKRLQDLVNRCLVLVCKKSLDGTKIRSGKVHDLIHDLCVREIQRENIFIMYDIVLDESDSERRYLIVHKMQPFKRVTGDEIDYCLYVLYRALLTPVHRQLRDHDNNDLLKRTRSIFSFHLKDSFLSRGLKSELIHFKLLKVLDLRQEIDNFPLQVLSLIWLRYLSLFCHKNLNIPPEICRLWNLQTFIVQGPCQLVERTFPEEIWGLIKLRNLKLPRFYLPDCPSGSVDKGRQLDFSNLQTISYLSSGCCTKEVIMGIQNVKELGIIRYEIDSNGLLNNLIYLQQLETLSLTYCFSRLFPAMLKKLKLERTYLSWSYLDIIAALPNLEVLKLIDDACDGEEWYPSVRGFNKLKFLLIEFNDLKYWKATNDNFPVLERLMIRSCPHLKEVPIEFADINTLQLIQLKWCLPELRKSAARIQKEQEVVGNNPVDVCFSDPLNADEQLTVLELVGLVLYTSKLIPWMGSPPSSSFDALDPDHDRTRIMQNAVRLLAFEVELGPRSILDMVSEPVPSPFWVPGPCASARPVGLGREEGVKVGKKSHIGWGMDWSNSTQKLDEEVRIDGDHIKRPHSP
ncbi:hypothetical protein BC332_24546 [Capsicum chinense]|nr:hypothetical protein BC332_24546 [Capsicum chinense]